MKKNLIAFLSGALGLILVWLLYQAYVMIQQHSAMWQWVQQTDRQLHPPQVQPEPPKGKP